MPDFSLKSWPLLLRMLDVVVECYVSYDLTSVKFFLFSFFKFVKWLPTAKENIENIVVKEPHILNALRTLTLYTCRHEDPKNVL